MQEFRRTEGKEKKRCGGWGDGGGGGLKEDKMKNKNGGRRNEGRKRGGGGEGNIIDQLVCLWVGESANQSASSLVSQSFCQLLPWK